MVCAAAQMPTCTSSVATRNHMLNQAAQILDWPPLLRRGKVGGASHFTLQCGRRLPDGSYQAPVVAMVASFSSSPRGLLSPEQAQTLFHEFGHALHSLLSRTELQHHFGASVPPLMCQVFFKSYHSKSQALRMTCMQSVGAMLALQGQSGWVADA